jgi:hypothetical protein
LAVDGAEVAAAAAAEASLGLLPMVFLFRLFVSLPLSLSLSLSRGQDEALSAPGFYLLSRLTSTRRVGEKRASKETERNAAKSDQTR